jgi:hypothetical protein
MGHPAKDRRYPRIGLRRGILIAWQGVGARVVSQIVTAGMGGLFIRASDPPAVGEIIRVYFELPGGEVRARAVVKSSEPGSGMGIEFTSMEPEARGYLARLLRELMPGKDPTKAPKRLLAANFQSK